MEGEDSWMAGSAKQSQPTQGRTHEGTREDLCRCKEMAGECQKYVLFYFFMLPNFLTNDLLPLSTRSHFYLGGGILFLSLSVK